MSRRNKRAVEYAATHGIEYPEALKIVRQEARDARSSRLVAVLRTADGSALPPEVVAVLEQWPDALKWRVVGGPPDMVAHIEEVYRDGAGGSLELLLATTPAHADAVAQVSRPAGEPVEVELHPDSVTGLARRGGQRSARPAAPEPE